MSQNQTRAESEELQQHDAEEAANVAEQQVPNTAQAETAQSVNDEVMNEATEEAISSGEDAASAEIAALKAQAEELHNKLLRSQADFDNFRRRARLDKEEFAKYASQKLLEQLLPVVDNYERALSAAEENRDLDSMVKGIDMIYRQLVHVLEQEGLQAIEPVGQPFDPEFHQAVMQVESEEYEEGIVVEEMQKGYKLKDKVIRPSMVKVSS